MKYPLWKPVTIVLTLALAAFFLSSKGLNKGIDLAGGTVLTYQVTTPDNVDAATAIDETITILSDRVDPGGVMNLVWRRVGNSRVEVQMPLASDSIRKERQAYEAQIDALTQAPVASDALDAALALTGDEQAQRLDALAADQTGLREQLGHLAQANQSLIAAQSDLASAEKDFAQTNAQLKAARTALADYMLEKQAQDEAKQEAEKQEAEAEQVADASETQEASDPKQGQLRVAVQNAENMDRAAYAVISEASHTVRQLTGDVDNLKAQVLQSPITPAIVDTIVNLSNKAKPEEISPRQQAIDNLKEQHPAQAKAIQKAFDAYAAYELVKGPLDDPEDLKALLRGSGVLEFRIAATTKDAVDAASYFKQLAEQGPNAGSNKAYVWRPFRDIERWLSGPTTVEDLNAMTDGEVQQYFMSTGVYGARYGLTYYMLLGNDPVNSITQRDKGWGVTGVQKSADETGFPAVSFTLNPIGRDAMRRITGAHVGKPMAIILDGKVISSPNINQALSNNVQVSGQFSNQEADYLRKTMKAGSLDATLSENPISEKTVGPTMGQENLQKGLTASAVALIAVSAFMILYYFFAGVVAVFGLLANMLLILGLLSFIDATFTLPGIAGLVLTIGMAVDANVLIFERIREEIDAGRKLHVAVKEGYAKALSTILDANITTLITCIVLGNTATADIKGFAVTLGIGIVATLFTALFGTKAIIDLYLHLGGRNLTMLPMKSKTIQGILSPKVNWLKLRPYFLTASIIIITTGLTLVGMRGSDMLDIEFRSGSAVSFRLSENENGEQQAMTRENVKNTLDSYKDVAVALADGKSLDAFDPKQKAQAQRLLELQQDSQERYEQAIAQSKVTGLPPELDQPVDFTLLTSATIVTEGEAVTTDNGPTAYTGFSIQTLITDDKALSDLVISAFGDKLRQDPSVSFAGDESTELTVQAPVYRISVSRGGQAVLGDNVEGLTVGQDIDVTNFLGGIAIVIDEMSSPLSVSQFEDRLDRIRRQPNFTGRFPDQTKVIGLRPTGTVQVKTNVGNVRTEQAFDAFVYLASDDTINYAQNIDAFRETDGFAEKQWQVVREAMVRGSSLESVTKFSAQVSDTMKQQAVVAITLSLLAVVIYVWLRFGSFRYGLAAIVCLVHDVAITLGLIGICHNLMQIDGLSKLFILEDFKINLAIVAAILTIIGYSLNDTIVIFDRIRENRGRMARATPDIINDSINQTISRTILTSGTTLIALFILYFLGGPGVHGFAFAMLMGVLIGTYSSIAIAAPLLLWGYKPGDENKPRHTPGSTANASTATANAATATAAITESAQSE